jgi:hypothetical protein
VNRFHGAILFVAAISVFARADCQPDKDFRTRKTGGVEVVDVNFSGASTVDSADLAEITNYMIGSCFDEKDWKFDETIYNLFHNAGYVSVQIDNLRTEPINREVMPTPVWVKGNVIEGQKCPTDARGSYQFLLGHRSDSLEVDPECVNRTFAHIGVPAMYRHNRFYSKALVDLLDFERDYRNDEKLITRSNQYPAIDALDFPAAVPYLIQAIKQNDNELVRTNAAEAIHLIYQSCVPAGATRLQKEADKPGATSEQKDRLQAAAEYVKNLYSGPRPCKSAHGQPATEEEVERELNIEGRK